MFVTKVNDLNNIYIKQVYETDKVIKFNLCSDGDKILYISPDFSNRNNTEGMICFGYTKGCIGIALDDELDRDFISLINKITEKVDQCIYSDGNGYKLDVHPISTYKNKIDGKDKKSLWCDVIQKGDNTYTYCYDINSNKVDIKTLCSTSLVRPCISFRVSYSKIKNQHRLRASVTELCVISNSIPRAPRLLPT